MSKETIDGMERGTISKQTSHRLEGGNSYIMSKQTIDDGMERGTMPKQTMKWNGKRNNAKADDEMEWKEVQCQSRR